MKIVKTIYLENVEYHIVVISAIGQGKSENQDSVSLCYTDKSISMAIADGLGSAVHSREGSEIISKITCEMLKDGIEKFDILKLKAQWKNIVKTDYDKYDTTLKFIHIDNNMISYGGIGDGWIGAKIGNKIVSLEAEHVFSNHTDTILSANLSSKFKVFKENNVSSFIMIMATDGFSEDIEKSELSQFLEGIELEIIHNKKQFADENEKLLLNWPIVTNTDDKTVVFIVRREITV